VLRTRVVTAALGLPILLGALYAGGATYLLLLGVVSAVASFEALMLLSVPRSPVPLLLGVLGAGIWLYVVSGNRWDLLPVFFGGFLGLLMVRQVLFHPAVRAGETASILLSCVYVGFTLGHFAALRELPGGFRLTMTVFLLTWTFDCAAYFVGRALGRRRLAPRLSPGKTWEGALAGAAACLAVAFIPWRLWPLSSGMMVVAAIVVIFASQLGDLFESSLKRFAGVKDSGVVLPGHGGILDRFDGLMFAVPAVYYLVTLASPGMVGG